MWSQVRSPRALPSLILKISKTGRSASDEVQKASTERGLKSKLHAALEMQLSMPASTPVCIAELPHSFRNYPCCAGCHIGQLQLTLLERMDVKGAKHMASLFPKEIKTIKEQGHCMSFFPYSNPPLLHKAHMTILLSSSRLRNSRLPLGLPMLLPSLQYHNTSVTLFRLGTEKKETHSSCIPPNK